MNSIWSTKKIGEVCEKFFLKKASIDSWPYIEISDINIENKSLFLKEKKSVEGTVIAPPNSIIVLRVRPTRGAIAFLDHEQVASSAFTILKVKDFETLPKFLLYSIAWSKEFITYLHRKQKGSNYPSVREKDILNFKIPVPPIETQRKIVEKLSAVQEYKKKLIEQKQKLKELFESFRILS